MSNIFDLDDEKLIEKFIQGSNQLLTSGNLRLEVSGNISQLMSRNSEANNLQSAVIAIMYLQNKPRTVIVKQNSHFLEIIDQLLIRQDFVMIGNASRSGFVEYKHYVTPAGYRIWYTDPSILWKKWWPTERFQNKQRFNMDILVSFKDNWYPVQNITVNSGIFTIKTIAGQFTLNRDNKVLWLAQAIEERSDISPTNNSSQSHPSSLKTFTGIADSDWRLSSADLAKKIQHKQSEISLEQALKMIKELEKNLQSQVKLTANIEEKCQQAEHRAMIAEQRLQIVYNYLHQKGVNPQDIYSNSSS